MTWPQLRNRRRIGVSVISEKHASVRRRLARRGLDRFADIDGEIGEDRKALIRDASAWLSCSLHDELPAGDHTIALLAIHRAHARPDVTPLVFHRSTFRHMGAPIQPDED
ncbi:flavin reductase family protein [Pseudonocardia kujensis]|uniref:flavin reductase family protein n=1 Tax=Pseudonocardia kujensis TaxID=1128675 RepID=UPI0027E00D70|nr:flavin reductase family protein [Pseudonocardia kujensis]